MVKTPIAHLAYLARRGVQKLTSLYELKTRSPLEVPARELSTVSELEVEVSSTGVTENSGECAADNTLSCGGRKYLARNLPLLILDTPPTA